MNGDVVDAQKLQESQQAEELKRQILSSMLERDAYERLGRVRMVNPSLAGQIDLYIVQIYQTGQAKGKITDEKLKGLLNMLSQKRKTSIKRS